MLAWRPGLPDPLSKHPLIPTSNQLRAKLEQRAKLRAGQQRLHEFTLDEKAILRGYLLKNTNTQYLA